MKYFGQTDVHGKFFENCLYRYGKDNQYIFEQVWNQNTGYWQPTTTLTGMIIHGECTLEPIDLLKAKEIAPDAFMESV